MVDRCPTVLPISAPVIAAPTAAAFGHHLTSIFQRTVVTGWFPRMVSGEEVQPLTVKQMMGIVGWTGKEPTSRNRGVPDSELDGISAEYLNLACRGYIRVAKALTLHSGEPWNGIRQLNHPDLMEQLIELYTVATYDSAQADSARTKRLMDYAISVAHIAAQRGPAEIQNALTELGQITYLVNESTDHIEGVVSDTEYTARLFRKALKQVDTRLNELRRNHQRAELQNPQLAQQTALPRELTRFILMKSGHLNFGVIRALHDHFVPREGRFVGYEINLIIGLELFAKNPERRWTFSKINAPDGLMAPGNRLIRQVLQLVPHAEVSDLQAKEVVLSALTSHLRQGFVGSCFATYLGIETMANDLARCMDDLIELIGSGKLSLKVKGSVEEFPFLLKMSHDSGYTEFTVNRSGELITRSGRQAYLWEAPGIHAALSAMGIPVDRHERVVKAALDSRFDGEPTIKLPMCQFVRDLAQSLVDNQMSGGLGAGSVANILIVGMEGQLAHPLLRAWEYTIASMAERHVDGLMMGLIIKSLSISLLFNYSKLEGAVNTLKRPLMETFMQTFLSRARIQYDPALQGQLASNDGHSIAGGFVLHDALNSEAWESVDTPENFQCFIAEILEETRIQMIAGQNNETDRQAVHDLLSELHEIIANPDGPFIGQCVAIYNYGVILPATYTPDPSALPRTPWIDKIGNNPDKVHQVYFEVDKPPLWAATKPHSADQLLESLLTLARNASPKVKAFVTENPYHLIPVRCPGSHIFSLIPGDPSFMEGWKNEDDSDAWMQQRLIDPGMEIASKSIQGYTRRSVLRMVRMQLISPEHQQDFDAAVEKIPKNCTYSEFRDRLLTAASEANKFQTHPRKLVQTVDSLLFEYLPPAQKQRLLESAVTFADTNWNLGSHDVHFGFMFNPFSKRLEIWQVMDDRSAARAVDQIGWVQAQPWEFLVDLGDGIPGEEAEPDERKVV
jgi:hypothetical protein